MLREDGEEEVCNYWMTLKIRIDPGTKEKSIRSHSREIAVERIIDLSHDRLRNDNHLVYNMHPRVNSFISMVSVQRDKTPLLMVNRRQQFKPKLELRNNYITNQKETLLLLKT